MDPPHLRAHRIRLTANGRSVAAGSAVATMAGLITGYAELLGLAGAGALLVVVSLLQVVRRPALQISRSLAPHRVEVGEAAMALLEVRVRGGRRGRPLAAVDSVGGRPYSVRLTGGADDLHRVAYEIDTGRRGVFEVGPLQLEQRDLFELAYRSRDLGAVDRLWVRPVVLPLVAPTTGRARDLEGTRTRAAAEGGVAFSGLREYVPGDDLRIVHWKGLARGGPLTVRTHVDSTRDEVLVVLDDRTAAYPASAGFEAAVTFAASVMAMAVRSGARPRIGLVGGGPVASGSLSHLLDALTTVEIVPPPESGAGPTVASSTARLGGRHGGRLAVVVLGPGSLHEAAQVEGLRRHWGSVVVAAATGARPVAGPAGGRGPDRLVAADAVGLAVLWNRRWS